MNRGAAFLYKTTFRWRLTTYDSLINYDSLTSLPLNLVNFHWIDSGNKIWCVGNSFIFEVDLSTPYDLTTMSDPIIIQALGNFSNRYLLWDGTGDTLYMYLTQFNRLYKYTFSTSFDITTLTSDLTFGGGTGYISIPFIDMKFKNNGTNVLCVSNGTKNVEWYSVNTAYDPTDITLLSYFNISSLTTVANIYSAEILDDGSQIYVQYSETANNYRTGLFKLIMPFDLSTAVYQGQTNVNGQDTGMLAGIIKSPDEKFLYTVGITFDNFYKYNTQL